MRSLLTLTLLVVCAAALLDQQTLAAAPSGQRCFPETGFCISGPIRAYWERNGGLPVFGYPISPVKQELVEGTWAGPVQWFERDRLEDHSNESLGVLAGRLGARSLEFQGINWQEAIPDNAAFPDCRFFRETSFNLCGPFLRYWEQNGGLERFGYPITRERQEAIEGRTYTVQYFERRRMELHPENAGTPYEVLLGLLGRDIFRPGNDQGASPVPAGDISAATQQPILDAAYTSIRTAWPDLKLAVGLVDVVGDYALVIGKPLLQNGEYVHLVRRGGRWHVVTRTPVINPPQAREAGFPAELLNPGDREFIIRSQLGGLQDPQGGGVNAYVTRPRIAGDFARFWVSPALSESRDPASTFYRRTSGRWVFDTAGTAFPEEQLREMGVPQELWPYGELVGGL